MPEPYTHPVTFAVGEPLLPPGLPGAPDLGPHSTGGGGGKRTGTRRRLVDGLEEAPAASPRGAPPPAADPAADLDEAIVDAYHQEYFRRIEALWHKYHKQCGNGHVRLVMLDL